MSETGDVNVPKLGPMNKKVLAGVGVAAAGFVGWRYYQSRKDAAAAAADTTDTTDPGFQDPGVLPSVSGAVDGSGLFGDGTTTVPTSTDYGFTGTTNDQWTQYVATQLSQSDQWSYTDILTALGAYLAGRPLSAIQQQIVQAAIAIGGHPPVGNPVVVSGGNTPITVAPTGVVATGSTSSTVTLSWQPVAGAAQYRVYRSGVANNVGGTNDATTHITIGGLSPNTSYTFYVAAETGNGVLGPRSAGVAGKTTAISLKAPSTPKVTGVTASGASASTGAVSGATGYNWYINNVAHGHSDAPHYAISGLKKSTKYTLKVTADNASQAPGPASGSVVFTTKK